jgi:hypothetical protein
MAEFINIVWVCHTNLLSVLLKIKNDDDNTPCESFIRGLYFNLLA